METISTLFHHACSTCITCVIRLCACFLFLFSLTIPAWGEVIYNETFGSNTGSKTVAFTSSTAFSDAHTWSYMTATSWNQGRNASTPSDTEDNTYTGASGKAYAQASTADATLILAFGDLSSYSDVQLSFGYRNQASTKGARAFTTHVSADGGSTWTEIDCNKSRKTQTWEKVTYNVPAASLTNFAIKFTSTSGSQSAVDDVILTGTAASCSTDPTVGDIMNDVSSITTSGATFSTSAGVSAGTDCSLSAVGFVYGTSENPTTSNSVATITSYTSGALEKSVTGLSSNTTYYVRAYATNSHGTTYSDQKSFKTNEARKYTVSFSTGGNNSDVDDITEASVGAGITLPEGPETIGCSGDGWSFVGWCATNISTETTIMPTLLEPDDMYEPSEDCTLYAVYSKDVYTANAFVNYTKVTSTPSDWSGKYLLSTGTYTATGAYSSNALACNSFTPGTTEATSREFTIAPIANTSDYSICIGTTYIGFKNDGTKLTSSNSAPTSSNDDKKMRWALSTSYISNVLDSDRKLAAESTTPGAIKAYSNPQNGSTYPVVFLYKRNEGKDITHYYSDPCATYPVTGVTLSTTDTAIIVGETFTITPTIAPTNATDKEVAWTSSASSYASVSDGTVTGVASGSATITCTTHDGSFTDECDVNVYSVTMLMVGDDGSTSLSGDGIPTAPTRSLYTLSVDNSTLYKFNEWRITNATLDKAASTQNNTFSSPIGDVTIKAVYYAPRTVTWIVNGEVYTTGSPTTTVARGVAWSTLTLPTDPTPCCGNRFVGWSTTDISANGGADITKEQETAITNLKLMTSANQAGKTGAGFYINNNITFYAVFADYAE